jgi:hypothetical protein
MDRATLRDRFRLNRPARGDQQARMEAIEQATIDLAMQLFKLTPPSPEQDAALVALDDVFNKGLAAIERNELWVPTEAWQLLDSSPGAAAHEPAFGGEGRAEQAMDRDREKMRAVETAARQYVNQASAKTTMPMPIPMSGTRGPGAGRLAMDEATGCDRRNPVATDSSGIVTRYR